MVAEKIKEILNQNGNNRSGIISILQKIQVTYKYLPEDVLRYLSQQLDIPLIELYAIASFYKSFSLTPRGKHLINVCLGTACHVRGGVPILEEIERKLAIKRGETTLDKNFTLETVNCLGACALGPIVVIDEDYHGNTKIQQVSEILQKYGYIAPEIDNSKN
jgi:NADH:ubiquinone oxidoreductase subunit E